MHTVKKGVAMQILAIVALYCKNSRKLFFDFIALILVIMGDLPKHLLVRLLVTMMPPYLSFYLKVLSLIVIV